MRLRKRFTSQFSAVPGPQPMSAHVGVLIDIRAIDDAGPRALLFELQVQSGVPICHLKPSASAQDVTRSRLSLVSEK